MPASLNTILEIATEITRQTGEFEVVGVIPAPGDSYAEILLSLKGCEIPPCRISMGVLRDLSPARMREVISGTLASHLAEHPTTGHAQ